MNFSITFLGAVGTVTGSKYLVKAGDRRLLIDCGLFQGFKQLRLRNWAPPPFDPASLDAVILTHAHLDHTGYLPLLVRSGFKGPVYATPGTRDLCGILLPDSGHLQERDAEFANRHGFSKHKPAKPLYTQKDAEAALANFKAVPFEKNVDLHEGLSVRFLPAGHILGAAVVQISVAGATITFSGDLGRSASGMATGGRILHHLKYYAPDRRNTVLFAGFQAGGTRGAAMTGGAKTVKIHGGYVPIHADVENLHMLSAHADADEIMTWLGHFEAPPRRTFITHGEPAASDALRRRIEEALGWSCDVPAYKDRADLN